MTHTFRLEICSKLVQYIFHENIFSRPFCLCIKPPPLVRRLLRKQCILPASFSCLAAARLPCAHALDNQGVAILTWSSHSPLARWWPRGFRPAVLQAALGPGRFRRGAALPCDAL
jgi:hypothetical protein